MEPKNYWKETARCGALVGLLLAVSFLLETRMMLAGSFGVYVLEWIVAVGLHYYLLQRFTRSYSLGFDAEEGFSFGRGYGFVLSVSAVAGVVLGVVQYLYLNLFLGYANYTERVAAVFTDMLARDGGVPASMQAFVAQAIGMIETAPAPSFLGTIWSGVFSSLLFGLFFGLIVAGIVARAPRPFGEETNEE